MLAIFLATVTLARGQQAVSSISQARLFTNSTGPETTSVDANGNALTQSETTNSGDGSFGTQIVLKKQERPRTFHVSGNVGVFYSNNVDLTPRGPRGDVFVAATVGAAWRPALTPTLVGDVSAGSSVFLYDRASELDFERISAGAGLSWVIPHARGIVAFGRYDLTELLDASGEEILQDHELTMGLQKTFGFGRSHYLTTGITGTLAKSRPSWEERDQAAIHLTYHFQITRSVDADLLYRFAAQFYDAENRVDRNQALSLALGACPTRWLRVEASISAARNDSNRAAFEYDVLSLGSGVRFDIRF